MRSRRFQALLGKEFRELRASRAYWLLLLMIGPLVGNAFITAVNSYAEASGIGGGPSALAQGLSPLDGVLVPTFGAYDLAATLLFPFVAIRLISAEKESGAVKLLVQAPISLDTMLAAKGLVLVAGWFVAWIPGLAALALWTCYGGSLYAPEVLNLILGHLLRVILASGVAFASAAVAAGTASAAIITLGFTVGGWALEFVAVGRGGFLQTLAAYTPTAALRIFEQGEFRLRTVLVFLILSLGGFAFAAVWLRPGRTLQAGLIGTGWTVVLVALALWGGSIPRASWDVSENRRNSFSPADEAALRQIRRPLLVTLFLAPEDPRLMDLDRSVLSKLRRILPRVDVDYAAHSRAGLFEGPGDHYGEVWYELGGRKAMSRSTTEPVVLEMLYQLGQIRPPVQSNEPGYSGHPLAAGPTGANWIFYGIWPGAISVIWWLQFRQWS